MTGVPEEEELKKLEEYPYGYFFSINGYATTLLPDRMRYRLGGRVYEEHRTFSRTGTHSAYIRLGYVPSVFFK